MLRCCYMTVSMLHNKSLQLVIVGQNLQLSICALAVCVCVTHLLRPHEIHILMFTQGMIKCANHRIVNLTGSSRRTRFWSSCSEITRETSNRSSTRLSSETPKRRQPPGVGAGAPEGGVCVGEVGVAAGEGLVASSSVQMDFRKRHVFE